MACSKVVSCGAVACWGVFRGKLASLLGLYGDYFSSIYAYREYLKQSVARDLRKQYKRSVLGYLWSMLHPLLMMAILAVVFSKIMGRPAKDYAVFLFSGMLPWRYFSGTAIGCLGTVRAHAKIMDHVPIPRYIFPTSTAFSRLIDFLLTLFPFFVVALAVGKPIYLTALALPLVLLPLFMVAMGVALLFAVANVFFDDTQHLATVLMQALYFLCPVLYSRDRLPEWLVDWLLLNPVFSIIEHSRDILFHGVMPDPLSYAWVFCSSALFLGFGLWVFKKSESKFLYFI